jgi:hypothetical protein
VLTHREFLVGRAGLQASDELIKNIDYSIERRPLDCSSLLDPDSFVESVPVDARLPFHDIQRVPTREAGRTGHRPSLQSVRE